MRALDNIKVHTRLLSKPYLSEGRFKFYLITFILERDGSLQLRHIMRSVLAFFPHFVDVVFVPLVLMLVRDFLILLANLDFVVLLWFERNTHFGWFLTIELTNMDKKMTLKVYLEKVKHSAHLPSICSHKFVWYLQV